MSLWNVERGQNVARRMGVPGNHFFPSPVFRAWQVSSFRWFRTNNSIQKGTSVVNLSKRWYRRKCD
jgi:hypothetical protein